MPYGRASNYQFVIDSSFQPFTMQEMLVPFSAYKEAYEKTEEAYANLSDKADTFSYLSKTLPEGSEARQIYEGYANDLRAQAEDLSRNGLSMGNRGALTDLKRRYQGEIGRLVRADEALKQEQALRRQMSSKDPSMLYANENLNIDSYLDGATPNLYGVSGNELYAKGAAAGKAASARIYSDPKVRKLDKYYNEYFSTMGYSPEKMQEFRENLKAIPELQRAAMDIAKANKVGELGEGSANYDAALQQIINGIADGAIYQRQSNMQRNLGVLTAAEAAADARARESSARDQQRLELSAAASGYKRVNGKWVRDVSAAGAYTVTNSGNPVYLDEKKRPYALGSDGKTKYYDNDKDGNYTDRNPFVKPDKPAKPVNNQEALQRTGGLGIMVAKKGGKWISNTTDNEYSDAGTYIPVFDNIWGTRSKLVDWGGDWNLSSKAKGKYRYIGDASNLPLEAIQSINESLPSKATLKDYDVYGVLSRNSSNLRDSEKYDYVLWPKGQPFPYNQTESVEQVSSAIAPAASSYVDEDDKPKV